MKSMKNLTYLLIFISCTSYSQDYGNKDDAIKLCTAIQSNNFSRETSADNALERILGAIGASKRFVLQPCDNINNAIATSFNGIRYILYDRDFMDAIDSGNNWGNLFILAHEVGHHINGHSLDILLYKSIEPKSLKQKRQQELEADEFAGFILRKLGATLSQTSEAINMLSSKKDDTYSTHPNKTKRLNAIKIGFNKALSKEQVIYEKKTNLNSAEEYFYRAYEFAEKGDYAGSISDLTKAIELNPNNDRFYYNRGTSYYKFDKDYYGAAEDDYNKAIKINPNFVEAYHNRGIVRNALNKSYLAISDFNKAIEINPNNPELYFNRGSAKKNEKNYYGAIADYTKALEINPNYFYAYLQKALTKDKLKDYTGAIADYTKALEINPNSDQAYFARALAKKSIEMYDDAIADYTKAIELNPNESAYYQSRGHLKNNGTNDYYGAIVDFTIAIDKSTNPNYIADYYNSRGRAKALLKNFNEALSDYNKAIKIDANKPDYYSNRGFSKAKLSDYFGAIADYTKAIQLNPISIYAFFQRGLTKAYLNDKNAACADFRKVQQLGGDVPKFFNNYCK
jgi:tetratricopeptide (TPR) repeat protein